MTDFTGSLQLEVYSQKDFIPIENALITIYSEKDPDAIINSYTTDSSGQTPVITLPAPDPSFSQSPGAQQPYAEYSFTVSASGYEEIKLQGSELMSGELSLQPIAMLSAHEASLAKESSGIPGESENPAQVILIPPHVLFGDYPPKLEEDMIKPAPETGEIVLSRVVIPEYVVVHDGIPSDSSAKNYYIRYKDYIKNVACCEIYPTWPEAAIYANILAIMSFTLNRVYTEWYRNRGYNFTITSSTAYDQKWVYGRNIYNNINYMVDSVFANYLSRPGTRQPLFASYCDGSKVSCKGLSQWGSRDLAARGYSAIQIIRHYYGNNVYISTADHISGVPSSYPGYQLSISSSGSKVSQMQNQLNRIAKNFPAIPKIGVDGIYGPKTAEAVKSFQKIFHLPITGKTDYATWYEISEIYVAVTRIAEPT